MISCCEIVPIRLSGFQTWYLIDENLMNFSAFNCLNFEASHFMAFSTTSCFFCGDNIKHKFYNHLLRDY